MPGKKGTEDAAPTAPAADKPTSEKKGKKSGEKKPKVGAEGKAPAPVVENPNFRHIVRFANTDLSGKRPMLMALSDVKGVGRRVAETVAHLSGLDPRKRLGDYSEAETEGLEELLLSFRAKAPSWLINHRLDRSTGENRHYVSAELDTAIRDDINMMKMIRCYRGIRHERGQKVRGQRTRSNGRTGMAAGVMKKTMQEAAKAAKAAKAAPEKK